MGRLNSFIKFVVLNANAFLFLGGIGTVVVASIILSADFITLAKAYIQARGIVVVASGVLIVAMAIIGCVGTHRQIQRDRVWSGRRLLSLYQILLITVMVGQGLVQIGLYRIEVNLEEAKEGLPEEYGEFESRFRTGFNTAYFDQQCPDQGGDSWIWSIVQDNCPNKLYESACQCAEGGGGRESPGSVLPASCANESTYSSIECCPDLEMCESDLDIACPYSACRSGMLGLLLDYITPARSYSSFVVTLEGVALVLTCLLICYNPRDSTEDILFKTGALVRDTAGFSAAGGASEKSGGGATTDLDYEVHLVQSTDGQGFLAGRILPPSTPAISPIGVSDSPPSVPLLQFMSPRHVQTIGDMVQVHDWPPDSTTFEFQNTAFSSKAFPVGPVLGRSAAAAVGPATKKTFAAEAALLPGGSAVATEMESSSKVGEATGSEHVSSCSTGDSEPAERQRGEEKVAEAAPEEKVMDASVERPASVLTTQVSCTPAVATVERPQKAAATGEEPPPRLDVPLDGSGERTRAVDSISSNSNESATPCTATQSDTNTGDNQGIAGDATAATRDETNDSDALGEAPLPTPVPAASTPIAESPSPMMAFAAQMSAMFTGTPPTPTPTAGTSPSSSAVVSSLEPAASGTTAPHPQLQAEVPTESDAFSNPTGGSPRFSAQTPISSPRANTKSSLPSTVGSSGSAAETSSGTSLPLPLPSPLPEASASVSTDHAQAAVVTGCPQLHVDVSATNDASSNLPGGGSALTAQTPIASLSTIEAPPLEATTATATAPPLGSVEYVNLQIQHPPSGVPVAEASPPHISPLTTHPPPPSSSSVVEHERTAPSPPQIAPQDAGEIAVDSSANNSSTTTTTTTTTGAAVENKSWFARVLERSGSSMSPPHISPLLPSTAATGSGRGECASGQSDAPVSAASGTATTITSATSSLAQQALLRPPTPPAASTLDALPMSSEEHSAAGVASTPAATTLPQIVVPPLRPTTISETAGESTGFEVPQDGDTSDGHSARGRVGMLEQTPPVSPPDAHKGFSRQFSTEPGSENKEK